MKGAFAFVLLAWPLLPLLLKNQLTAALTLLPPASRRLESPGKPARASPTLMRSSPAWRESSALLTAGTVSALSSTSCHSALNKPLLFVTSLHDNFQQIR